MAARQFAAEEPEASMISAFAVLITSESIGFTAVEGLSVIMKLSRNSTRVVTILPLHAVPFVLSGASYKGIVSG